MSDDNAAQSPRDEITVRMYRRILGDCFLVTHRRGDRAYHALIDCGVLQCIGNKRPKTKAALTHLPDILRSITADTGGRLDLLVVTHEHYDHMSGFLLENAAFDALAIDRLWVAWTEDRGDAEANDIRVRGKKAVSALKAVAAKANAFGVDAAARDQLERIESLLQFYDDEIEPWTPEAFGAAPRPPYVPPAKPRSCENAIVWLRHKVGEAKVDYLEPGDVMKFGLDDALTAYVFGPPRSQRLLQLNPSSGSAREVYLTKRDDVAGLEGILRAQAFGVAAPGAGVSPSTQDFPFAARFRRTEEDLAGCAVKALYEEQSQANKLRRIDGEWLGSAEFLALKIDGDVNNTSLVLAIEAPGPQRHVMLFAADAQVGNWLSWHDQPYPAKPKTKDEPQQTAKDILRRVVLYKVGHHGSHNATARDMGLELMTSPYLTALIPVVEDVAREQTSSTNTKGWAMPYPELRQRLRELTRDRILKGDGEPLAEAAAFQAAPGLLALRYADATADPVWAELTLTTEP